MNKSIPLIISLSMVMLLASCSKNTPHQQHLMKICTAYMQEAKILKQKIEKIKQDNSKDPMDALQKSVAVGEEYQSKIEKPYGVWQTACFTNLPKDVAPNCSSLVKYVQQPKCATATESTFKVEFPG
jgi:hypothetical protein